MALAVSQSRNVRSRCRCSVCPAIHINSRSWLRSSSTHEPSDPPHRVVSDLNRCLPPAQHGQKSCALSPERARIQGLERARGGRGFLTPRPAQLCKNVYVMQERRSILVKEEGERGADLPRLWLGRSPCRPDESGPIALRGPTGHPRWIFVYAHVPVCCFGCLIIHTSPCVVRVYCMYVHSAPHVIYTMYRLCVFLVMIHPQVHLRIPCYDFYFLYSGQFAHLLGTTESHPERQPTGPIRRAH